MNTNSDFEKQKKVDYLAWEWLPRGTGFWTWFIIAIYLWKFSGANLDRAATIGLGIGISAWIVVKILTVFIGPRIIYLNLWEYGCGCLVRTIAIELFQYFAIAFICALAIKHGDFTITTAIIFFIIGSLNWLLISFKNL